MGRLYLLLIPIVMLCGYFVFIKPNPSDYDEDCNLCSYEYRDHRYKIKRVSEDGIMELTDRYSSWVEPEFKVGDTVYSDMIKYLSRNETIFEDTQVVIVDVKTCKRTY